MDERIEAVLCAMDVILLRELQTTAATGCSNAHTTEVDTTALSLTKTCSKTLAEAGATS